MTTSTHDRTESPKPRIHSSIIETTDFQLSLFRAFNACKHLFLFLRFRITTSIIKMSTIALVTKALLDLKPRTGASVPAITKWIETNEKVSTAASVLKLFSLDPRRETARILTPNRPCLRNGDGDISSTKPSTKTTLIYSDNLLTE